MQIETATANQNAEPGEELTPQQMEMWKIWNF